MISVRTVKDDKFKINVKVTGDTLLLQRRANKSVAITLEAK